MLTDEEIKNTILQLAKIDLEIDLNGGPAENSDLFEKSYILRSELLKHMGLPNSPKYAKLLCVESLPLEKELDNITHKLKKAATHYLLSPVKTNVEILLEAYRLRRKAVDVLPELGFKTHIYNIFLYDNCFLILKINPRTILDALQLADESEVLNLLGTMTCKEHYGEEEMAIYQGLKNRGIKFLEYYLLEYYPNADLKIDLENTSSFFIS